MADGDTIFSTGRAEKIIAIVLAIGTVLFSAGGNYLLTSYRLTDQEKRLDAHETRITSLEQNGRADDERRIAKLESHSETADSRLNEMSTKIDVAITILSRVESELHDQQNRGSK
jgi:hypothetical protein